MRIFVPFPGFSGNRGVLVFGLALSVPRVPTFCAQRSGVNNEAFLQLGPGNEQRKQKLTLAVSMSVHWQRRRELHGVRVRLGTGASDWARTGLQIWCVEVSCYRAKGEKL